MGVFLLFLLALGVGLLTTLYWVPGEDLGRGYFQMNALVALGLLALALPVAVLAPLEPFGARDALGRGALIVALAAAFLYHGAIWRRRWRLALAPLTLCLAGCGVALWLAARHLTPTYVALPHRSLLLVAALVSGSLLLGWSLVTMLLGHWYLVAPRLAFRHLILFCATLVALVLARGAAVAATLATSRAVEPLADPHPWRLLVDFGGQGMFFWFRLLWGLLMPLLLGLMALHCARNRSNQSATGILYVLVVGSLIGELTALYLTLTTGVPV